MISFALTTCEPSTSARGRQALNGVFYPMLPGCPRHNTLWSWRQVIFLVVGQCADLLTPEKRQWQQYFPAPTAINSYSISRAEIPQHGRIKRCQPDNVDIPAAHRGGRVHYRSLRDRRASALRWQSQ